MGLDAFVSCDCYDRGLTPPPPAPVVVDPETGLIDLVDWRNSDLWEPFAQWRGTGCPHKDMEFAGERVGNWTAVRHFELTLP